MPASKLVHHTAQVNGISMHYVVAGQGPPVFLLHGFPETWYCWRHQIPALAEHYTVIAPDLRGYGHTEKPAGGYDKHTTARDILCLMRHCGYHHAHIVGHDRGARVATRFAKHYPDLVERLVVIDNIPTRIIFERMDANVARGHWFFIFKTCQTSRKRSSPAAKRFGCASSSPVGATTRTCSRPKKSAFMSAHIRSREPYEELSAATARAAKTWHRMRPTKTRWIACPTLALWGEDFSLRGKMWNFREVWSKMARHMSYVSIPQCDHLPHEEKPEVVNTELLKFLAASDQDALGSSRASA